MATSTAGHNSTAPPLRPDEQTGINTRTMYNFYGESILTMVDQLHSTTTPISGTALLGDDEDEDEDKNDGGGDLHPNPNTEATSTQTSTIPDPR
ncbi:hypothetical protein DL767_004668 [Monosporascus sp. MG133]|nr:hypothetical protein DL767_004668 [Monosporascus sp. MG133]